MEVGALKWFQKWKERKQLKQRQSTRQLMGVRKVLPHGVAVSGGCLVFFLIHPNNLSVLSAEGIRQRVTALSNLFRAEEQVEVLALDSRVSFQKNQAYYQTRLEEETTPKIRELLQKDIAHLDAIQATSASSREFVLVLRMEEQAALVSPCVKTVAPAAPPITLAAIELTVVLFLIGESGLAQSWTVRISSLLLAASPDLPSDSVLYSNT